MNGDTEIRQRNDNETRRQQNIAKERRWCHNRETARQNTMDGERECGGCGSLGKIKDTLRWCFDLGKNRFFVQNLFFFFFSFFYTGLMDGLIHWPRVVSPEIWTRYFSVYFRRSVLSLEPKQLDLQKFLLHLMYMSLGHSHDWFCREIYHHCKNI